jgi:S1-C subfamily serine protease
VRRGGPLALVALVVALAAGCSAGDDERDESAAAGAPTTRETTTTSPDAGEDVFGRIPEIVDAVEPSVVTIATDNGEGSGVVWDDQGLVVTNNHVVAGASEVEVVLASGARLPAQVDRTDERADLAVLRVEREGLPPATFRKSLPDVGELAIAMGNPLGFEQSVTAGIVSGVHRSVPSGGQTPALVDLIQTDAAISPGNSGGALVDENGEVMGINVAYIPPQAQAVAIGFAIPSPTVIDVVRQLLEKGEVDRAYLGVGVVEITPDLAEQLGLGVESGVAIESVSPGGAAARAGIRGGDIIVAIEGKPIGTVEDLYAELNRHRPGERVSVTVVRDGERRSFDVTLDEAP